MIESILNSLNIESHKEQFFTEGIIEHNIKLYPFYDLSMITNLEKFGNCSIKPIAIIICELVNDKVKNYYLYHFDDSDNNEKYTKDILNRFCIEILGIR